MLTGLTNSTDHPSMARSPGHPVASKTSSSVALGLRRPQITGFGTWRPHLGDTLDAKGLVVSIRWYLGYTRVY